MLTDPLCAAGTQKTMLADTLPEALWICMMGETGHEIYRKIVELQVIVVVA